MYKVKKEFVYTSVFADTFKDYLEQNNAIGNKYHLDAVYLKQFDEYLASMSVTKAVLTQDLYEGWCQKRDYETDVSHHIRIRTLRRFCIFLANNGFEAYTKFPKLPHLQKNYLPYIFTDDEVKRLLAATDNLPKSNHSPLAHLIMPTLFRMLYCCGLRVSEALALKINDVDLKSGVIFVEGSKFGKDRYVPMSKSLLDVCGNYASQIDFEIYGNNYFFPSPDNGHFSTCTIYARFRKFLFAAGISHGGRGKGPRLHDLRHTYAVHCLRHWTNSGKDIYIVLPILAKYLGHKNISATGEYLRLTPEVYPEITKAFEESFGSVFPEVTYEE